jgi:hypothetical protein
VPPRNDDQREQKVQHMQQSLDQMTATLHTTAKELPTQLQSLQETVAVIQHHLTAAAAASGGCSGVSPTEQASVQRDLEVLAVDEAIMSPQERLAAFLG